MNREKMRQQLGENAEWDLIIIGGGATGLGIAVDAATRGYKTLLLEQHDFAKGTSSRSTKLVHGGVRYLAQGNIKLVREALKERGLLLKNAPHVSHNLSFVLPCYTLWQKFYYGIGLMAYDLMAGNLGLGKTKIIGSKKAKLLLPTINPKKLSGAIVYQDGQFDDARLAINLAQTAAENGATVLNYCQVSRLLKVNNKVIGVIFDDLIDNEKFSVRAKAIINATGVFADEVLQMDNVNTPNMVSPSQGIHLVMEKKFFPGPDALMIPKTTDGRVLFAVPWHENVVVGTTDTPIASHSLEPKPLEEEINFILTHLNKYLDIKIDRPDIKSVFVGLRPLVKKGSGDKTSIMPRDHTIIVSESKLVTITGGKWTTYRRMASDVLDKCIELGLLEKRDCQTEHLKIHGWVAETNINEPLHYYGSDAYNINNIYMEDAALKELIHDDYPNTKAEIIWAIDNEMAETVEDILARRTRLLFLDARAAVASCPEVAKIMAEKMNKSKDWQREQISSFQQLASQYLLS